MGENTLSDTEERQKIAHNYQRNKVAIQLLELPYLYYDHLGDVIR